MKKALVIFGMVLLMLSLASVTYAETSVLTWDAPTTNTDGTPITERFITREIGEKARLYNVRPLTIRKAGGRAA